MTKHLTTAIWLSCIAAACAGEPTTVSTASTEYKLPNFSAGRAQFTYSDEMDFDDLNGSLSTSEFELTSALSRPITVAGDIMLLPLIQYGWAGLDFDGVTAGDEDLHSVSLHLAAIKLNSGSPWFYGGWVRAELASDFQHINDDDFTFDVAGGVGYRFNERFALGAGVVVIDINGDTWACPGITFDWQVNDQTRIGLYGPIAIASYSPDENWSFSLRGAPGGGRWNITDDSGDSKTIDLDSYQVGVFASRRLTDKIWLNAGVGMTVGNNLEYADPDGENELFDEDMESGLFGQIGITLRAW